MKKIIVLFLFVIVFVDISARTITVESARMTAQRFVSVNTGKEDTLCLIGNNPFRHFYVFGGTVTQSFVIISADDRVIPVLGYSLNSKFDGFSDDMLSVKDWLKSYDDQIEYLIQHHVEPSPEILKKWQSVGDVAVSQVRPLVSTMWNQDGPFNAHCPIDVAENQNCKTGCVATAMAQVMNYWEFPEHGEGTISYSWNGVTISENLGNTTFDWSNMKDDYRLTCTDAERDAVATLMKSVGVATKMKYGESVSSTYTVSYGDITYACAENALKYNFHYSKNLYSAYYDNYGNDRWIQMMIDEIKNSRPVIYSGLSSYSSSVGHSFVLDGYDSDDKFHINWGYSGNNDGFFAIGQLHYGNTSYDIDNKAIIHIEPDHDYNPGTSTTITADAGTGGKVEIYDYDEDGVFSVGDTVEIIALAQDGYRFSKWSDNSKDNPRYLIADGKNYSYHAEYEDLRSDTIAYCNDFLINSAGIQSSTTLMEWGMIIPKSVFGKAFRLDELLYYAYMSGSYTVHVWEGNEYSEMNVLYEETFPVTASHQWVSLKFAQSVDLNNINLDYLWIWLSSDFTGFSPVSGGYWPMSYSLFSGSLNGSVFRFDGGKWSGDYNITFLLKAICSDEMTITDNGCTYRLHKAPNTAEVVDCEYSETVRDLTKSDGSVLHYENEVRIPDEIEYNGLKFAVTSISTIGEIPQSGNNVAFHVPNSVKEIDCSLFPQNSLLLFQSNSSPDVKNVGNNVTGCFITADEVVGADTWNGHAYKTSYPYNVVGGTITQRPYFGRNMVVTYTPATDEFYNNDEHFKQTNLSTTWDFSDGISKVSSDDSRFEGTLTDEAVLEVMPKYDAVISGESPQFVYTKGRMFRNCHNLTIEDGASYNVISFADDSEHKTIEAEHIKIRYNIDNVAFRYISLPFDCNVEDVVGLPYLGIDLTEVTSLGADHWTAYAFDEGYTEYGEGCANYSDSLDVKFRVVPADGVLEAGRGYAVAIVESDEHIDNDVKATIEFNKSESVEFYALTAGRESMNMSYSTSDRWCMRGWNLIGNPYWGTVCGSTFGSYVSKIDNGRVVEHSNDIEEVPIAAFEALYFQTATPGSRTLTPSVHLPVENVRVQNHTLCDYITLDLLSGDSVINSTTIIDKLSASDDFVIEEDLSSMSSQGIASLASGVRCRFNELSLVGDTVVVHLTVKVDEGQYTIDYNRQSRLPETEIALIDYSDGKVYDIDQMPLTFYINAESRYALKFSPREVISSVESSDDDRIKVVTFEKRITVSGVDSGEKVELYDISGRMISSAIAVSDVVEFDIPVRGVYLVNCGGRVVKTLCGR